jgi:hypothetical protein
MRACNNLLREPIPVTPNNDVRRCNSFRNSAHVYLWARHDEHAPLHSSNQKSARARYVRMPGKNSELSHDLDVIVKPLALNGCKRNPSNSGPSAARLPFSIENKTDCRFSRACPALDTQLLSLWHQFRDCQLKGESEIVWLNNHQTAIVQS